MRQFLKKCSGFSLVELIVVIAIISILLSIVTLNFNEWQKKNMIERYATMLYTDLNGLRQRAMTRKMAHNVTLDNFKYVFRQFSSAADDGNATSSKILDKSSEYVLTDTTGAPLSNLVISFDIQGYTNNNATIVIGPVDSLASTNCLRIHTARINIGKMTGGACVFK